MGVKKYIGEQRSRIWGIVNIRSAVVLNEASLYEFISWLALERCAHVRISPLTLFAEHSIGLRIDITIITHCLITIEPSIVSDRRREQSLSRLVPDFGYKHSLFTTTNLTALRCGHIYPLEQNRAGFHPDLS